MALRLREIALKLGEDESLLSARVAAELQLPEERIAALRIVRKGIDARRKPQVLRVYTVEFSVADEAALLAAPNCSPRLSRVEPPVKPPINPPQVQLSGRPRILVAGMGPAGLFAALQLAEAGAGVCLIERGQPVEQRLTDVRRYWAGEPLNPESNIQFGEGGAGTFSDGKLTSRLSHPLMRQVLETLVGFGAPREILWQAKPHVGSDRLRQLLVQFRKRLIALGVEIRFASRLSGFSCRDGQVVAGILNGTEEYPCDSLVLAPGHSARDTYRMLQQTGVVLQSKPFAIGLRVEHPAELINRIQYGLSGHPQLPPAEYALTWNDPQTKRGIYSFCMCPGGMVVNAASETGGVVVNGMSDYRRDGESSNSALVVSVRPEDFAAPDPLAGVRFQQQWEQAAFAAAGGSGRAPAQPLLEFLQGRGGSLQSTCQPQVVHTDLSAVLPEFVTQGLRRALPHFNRRMRGFVGPEATLVGVETRTSAPLRILRDQQCQSLSHRGLFPAGEGAGYAGGIMSAAVDGLRVAESLLQRSAAEQGG